MTTPSSPPQATSPAPTGRTTFRTLAQATDRSFLVLGIAARLPTAMLPLGILLYVADRTGSFASGGLAVAALSIGGGLGGPLVRRRRGPVRPAPGAARRDRRPGARHRRLPRAVRPRLAGADPGAGRGHRDGQPAGRRDGTDPLGGHSPASARPALLHRHRDGLRGRVDESSFVAGPVLVSTIAAARLPHRRPAARPGWWRSSRRAGSALHHSALPGRSSSPVTAERTRRGRCRGCTWPGCCSRWPRSALSSAPRRPAWPRGSTASAATG